MGGIDGCILLLNVLLVELLLDKTDEGSAGSAKKSHNTCTQVMQN